MSYIMFFVARVPHRVAFAFLVLTLVTRHGETADKQKLLGLIKKLEKLADKMELGGSSNAVVSRAEEKNKETVKKEEREGPLKLDSVPDETATKKKKVPKPRDASKTYCESMECPTPTCTAKDVYYYAMLRIKTPFPPILELCEAKIHISPYQKNFMDTPNTCCLYNQTHMTINNENLLGCAQTSHDWYRKANPPTGVSYWTSAKWSKSCNNYVWCPEKEVIAPDVKWRKGYPKSGAGDCVAIQIGSKDPDNNGLFNMRCSEQLKIFCIEYNNWSLY